MPFRSEIALNTSGGKIDGRAVGVGIEKKIEGGHEKTVRGIARMADDS